MQEQRGFLGKCHIKLGRAFSHLARVSVSGCWAAMGQPKVLGLFLTSTARLWYRWQEDCGSAPWVFDSWIQAKGAAPKWEAGQHKGFLFECGMLISSAHFHWPKLTSLGWRKDFPTAGCCKSCSNRLKVTFAHSPFARTSHMAPVELHWGEGGREARAIW